MKGEGMKKRLAVLLCLMLFGGAIIGNSVEASAASVDRGTYVKSDNEHNPLVTQNYGADPGVMVYNDTVYIYTTNDSQELTGNNENTYGKITTLNCYSSKDMVNWTDHGSFNVAGSNGAAKWVHGCQSLFEEEMCRDGRHQRNHGNDAGTDDGGGVLQSVALKDEIEKRLEHGG